jgi:hypothetical protein
MDRVKSGNDIYVTLSYSPLGLIGARATGILMDGISVDTGAVSLPRHSEVEVTLSYRKDKRLQVHRIAALVTERTAQGTRLAFQSTSPEMTKALAELQARQTTTLEGVA